jgi:O-antigen ligase
MRSRIDTFTDRTAFGILFAWVSFFPESVRAFWGAPAACFLGLFLYFLCRRRRPFFCFFGARDWFLLVFLLLLAAGIVFPADKFAAGKVYLYLTTILFFLFYIGKILFCSNEGRSAVAVTICVCGSLVALFGLLELVSGRNLLYEYVVRNPFYPYRYLLTSSPRPMSTQFNPAVLGSYLLGCLPFGLVLLEEKSAARHAVGFMTVALCATVTLLTFSRGVLLGLIALLLFYFWNAGRRRGTVAFLGGVLLFIALASFQKDPNLSRYGFRRFLAGSPDSILSEYRFDRVAAAARMVRESPLTGIGLRQSILRFDDYYTGWGKSREPKEFKVLDNMYLTVAAETGVVGISGFLIFVFMVLRRGFQNLKSSRADAGRWFLGPLAGFVGLLVNMGAYELFYWTGPYMVFCLLCGFICSGKPGARTS